MQAGITAVPEDTEPGQALHAGQGMVGFNDG
jgi:hypothetical protein